MASDATSPPPQRAEGTERGVLKSTVTQCLGTRAKSRQHVMGGWYSLSQEGCGWQAEERSLMRLDKSGSVGGTAGERGEQLPEGKTNHGAACGEPDWGVSV